jgi:hypothetical protein
LRPDIRASESTGSIAAPGEPHSSRLTDYPIG